MTSVRLLFAAAASFLAGAVQAQALHPQPGVFTGRVTTEAGRPLAKALVVIGGVTNAGERVSRNGHTDGNGVYAIAMPPGSYSVVQGSWQPPDGYAEGEGPLYLPLALTDGPDGMNDPAPIGRGIVRNLVLKLRGPAASGHHFGFDGDANPVGALAKTGFGAGSVAEFTFTPNGPFPDGSVGKPVVVRVPSDDSYYPDGHLMVTGTLRFQDVPMGRYRLTGRLVRKDGSASPLLVALWYSKDTPAPAMPVVIPRRVPSYGPDITINERDHGVQILHLKVDAGVGDAAAATPTAETGISALVPQMSLPGSRRITDHADVKAAATMLNNALAPQKRHAEAVEEVHLSDAATDVKGTQAQGDRILAALTTLGYVAKANPAVAYGGGGILILVAAKTGSPTLVGLVVGGESGAAVALGKLADGVAR